MPDSVIPTDRYEAKESGRAIQEAQNTVMAEGAKATAAMLRELLKSLKLPRRSAYVQISINDSVAYRATIRPQDEVQLREMGSTLSGEQMSYLKEVVKLPESEQPAASIPLDRDVTVEVNGKEVFRLKNGVVERNLLVPAPEKPKRPVSQAAEVSSAQSREGEEKPAEAAQVEVVGEDVRMPEGTGVSLSEEQKQGLQKLGVNPERVENAIGQQAQGNVPIIVVLNREVERNFPGGRLKDNLQVPAIGLSESGAGFFQEGSPAFLGSAREKLFPNVSRGLKQDLQNLAVVNTASKLLDRFGGETETGGQVFEGNSFRLERQGKELNVIAKDGRGTILSPQRWGAEGFSYPEGCGEVPGG